MCDCVASSLLTIRMSRSSVRHRNLSRFSCVSPAFCAFRNKSISLGFDRNVSYSSRIPGGLGFQEFQFDDDLGVKGEDVLSDLGIEKSPDDLASCEDDEFREVSDTINELATAGVEFLERNLDGLKSGRRRKKGTLRSGRNLLKRSSLVAKQVISIQSALSLGFISQLWVDAATWHVQAVEVRASLLSGESERFLYKDVSRVGDVVLVRDEGVMDSETQLIGLETLVGYDVITAGGRRIGKVRGFSFHINSGALETLEFDSFGISIIPSSLVSTYVLLVADVLEVLPDEVVVHEAAASRIQRLTRGIWGTKSKTINSVGDTYDVDLDIDPSSLPLEPPRSSRKKFSRKKYHRDTSQKEDDWELPIDYL